MIMGTIRDQLQTLTGASLEASQLSQAGGQVFVSANATKAQADLDAVVQFWRSIHVPTYGQPIPGTGSTRSAVGDVVLLGPSTNQTAYITAIDFTNADPALVATVELTVDGVSMGVTTVPALSTVSVVGIGGIAPFMLANGQNMSQSITGVPAPSVTGQVAYSLMVQG